MYVATGSEEVGFLKENLGSLYQDLDKEPAVSIESVRERVKEYLVQAQTAFDKLRLERQRYLDRIDQQTRDSKKIKDALEALELKLQGIIIFLNNYVMASWGAIWPNQQRTVQCMGQD
jgi:hypothetical protein